jgi:hypothetical protein
MCFNPLGFLFPKSQATPTVIPKTPDAPTADSDAVRQREMREAELLAARGGTAATVRTDLDPNSIKGNKKVLLGV